MKIRKFLTKNYKILLIIFILTIFSIFINGYFQGTADNALRSVIIKSRVDSTLYKNDLMVSQASTFYTYVHFILIPLVKLLGLESALFFLRFLGIFFGYIAIFYLSKTLFKDNRMALLSVLLLLVIKPAMGGDTFRPIFVESDIALPLMLFAFMFMLKKNYFFSSFLAGIAVNLHITHALPAFGILFIYMLFNYKKVGIKNMLYSLGIFFISALPMFLWIIFQKSSVRLVSSDFLISVLKLVSIHQFFPLSWFTRIYIERWIRFFIFFAAYLVAFKYKPDVEKHKAVKIFFCGIVILIAISIFFTYVIPQPLIMNLQMVRATMWISFFGAIYLSNYLLKEYDKAGFFSKLILVGLGSSFFISNFKGILIFLIFLLADKFRKINIISIPVFISGLFGLILSIISTFYPNTPFSVLKIGTLPFFIIGFSIAIALILETFKDKIKAPAKNFAIALAILVILIFASFGMTSLRALFADPFYGSSVFELSLTGVVKPNPISLNAFKQILSEPGKHVTHNVQYLYKFPRNDWEKLQAWVNKNTKKDDIFVTPPHLTGFRMYSERTIVGEWLEVVMANVNEDYAVKIWERMKDLCNSEIFGHCEGEYGYDCSTFCGDQYKKLDEKYFEYLAKKYNADYTVVERPKSLNFDLVYENNGYRLYKINK